MTVKPLLALVLACVALLPLGCDRINTEPPKGHTNKKEASDDHNYKGRDWCRVHEMPESTCSMCSNKVAAEFKKAGDWCDKHDRAKSQCFICDPKLKDKFAADYKAKYNEDPPPITDEK